MTEMGEEKKAPLILHFLGALALGPIVGAVMGLLAAVPAHVVFELLDVRFIDASFLLTPLFGLTMGLPYYAIAGTPAFILALRARRTRVLDFALVAFLANLASPVIGYTLYQDGRYAYMLLVAGSIAAPVWGAGFALSYGWLRRSKQ